jgi:hypothetical protein
MRVNMPPTTHLPPIFRDILAKGRALSEELARVICVGAKRIVIGSRGIDGWWPENLERGATIRPAAPSISL